MGLVFQAPRLLLLLVALAISAWALPYAADNASHPLVGPRSIFVRDQIDQYFRFRKDARDDYLQASEFVRSTQCQRVGIMITYNNWEQPLWTLLPALRANGGQLEHVADAQRAQLLAGPRSGSFSPCVVMSIYVQAPETLDISGQTFRRVWATSPKAGKTIDVYVT